jgi:flagellar biosynthesis/type III secretory pathway protein FliH
MTSSTDRPGLREPGRSGREAVLAWAPVQLGTADLGSPSAARAGAGGGEPWIAPLLELEGPSLVDTHLDHGPPEDAAQAYARGHADGLEQGAAQGREPLERVMEALRGAVQAVASDRGHYLRDLEANLSALAVLVAGKIVRREVTMDPELVRELVAHALQLVKPDSPVIVRLHPEDLRHVQGALEALSESEAGTVKFAADEHLEAGSFFVEGPHRIVDGRLNHVLTELYERLAYD